MADRLREGVPAASLPAARVGEVLERAGGGLDRFEVHPIDRAGADQILCSL
jgi:hypothetical protein